MMIKKKRGASLAESVVALAVITIVSMAAISAVAFALNAQVKALRNTKAQDFARSVFESFKVSDDDAEFVANIVFAEEYAMADSQTDGDYKKYIYTSTKYDFVAEIKVLFSTDTSKLIIEVREDDDDDVVIFFEYTKGGRT